MSNRVWFAIVFAALVAALVGTETKDTGEFLLIGGLAVATGVVLFMVARYIALRFVTARWASLVSAGLVAGVGFIGREEYWIASVPIAVVCLGLDMIKLPPVDSAVARGERGDKPVAHRPRRKKRPVAND